MECEIMLTGIGGQGIQLAAQILARAAVHEGLQVMFLGTYGGTMRGGQTDATLVVADERILAPPLVSHVGSALAMHHAFFAPIETKLRAGAVVLINESVFEGDIAGRDLRVLRVPATAMAADLGHPLGACMVLIGAFAAATELVGIESLLGGMRESIPSYRRQNLDANEKALREGYGQLEAGVASLRAAGGRA
ncbi:MAG: 2-oxoacid:acceptor oxidoreductase family protein [Deltaproteobacteria bacterium]|nr:2-oxoacid:acceptor oxidoreductase family protein [Deltaproteobacteria bacterium]